MVSKVNLFFPEACVTEKKIDFGPGILIVMPMQ